MEEFQNFQYYFMFWIGVEKSIYGPFNKEWELIAFMHSVFIVFYILKYSLLIIRMMISARQERE